jgi:hypothetical protein
MIVLDSLTYAVAGADGGVNFQQNILPPLQALKRLATNYNVAVLVVTHSSEAKPNIKVCLMSVTLLSYHIYTRMTNTLAPSSLPAAFWLF